MNVGSVVNRGDSRLRQSPIVAVRAATSPPPSQYSQLRQIGAAGRLGRFIILKSNLDKLISPKPRTHLEHLGLSVERLP